MRSTINDAFSRLEAEKQRRIRDAALMEFAKYGYEQASTNRMVEKADISKGMLFYYFQSKKDLYLYLIEYSFDWISKEYIHLLDESETDLIEKYANAAKTKMMAYTKNPYIFDFLGSLYINEKSVLTEEIQERLEIMKKETMNNLLHQIDYTLFRDDVDTELMMKMIHWIMEGYQQEIIHKLQGKDLSSMDYSPYWEEFSDLLVVLKKVLYRQEEANHDHS